MSDYLVKMARLAQRDERMSTGALYGDLADRIEELEAKAKLHWQSSQRIGEAMYRLHKLKYWLDMDQELFDAMTDQQQADHKYIQTAVDGIIWALKGEK